MAAIFFVRQCAVGDNPALPRLGPRARMRLCALIGERRIEMLPLRLANRTRHVAIARIWDALQGGGKVEQEGVTACHS
jgi:hypothetical protein